MRTTIFWVNAPARGRLGIMARPRAGDWLEDEVKALREAKVDVVVSLLTLDEEEELGLGGERAACEASGLTFVSFPIPDRAVPAADRATNELLESLCVAVRSGRSVVAHCRMGIGRSSLIAASVLVRLGVSIDEAWARLTEARGLRVPDTDEQREWVRTHFAL